MLSTTSPLEWSELYRTENTPWEDGRPWSPLGTIVRDLLPRGGNILDVGCGAGTQSIHLARLGFHVWGFDIADAAIESARSAASAAGVEVHFSVADFYSYSSGNGYDLVFDRGVFANVEDRPKYQFAERVASALAPGGWWLDVTGCADNRAPGGGEDPRRYPRFSLSEIIEACETFFEIHSVCKAPFGDSDSSDFIAWVVVMRVRQKTLNLQVID